MTLYNKTKSAKKYGNDRFSLVLPASATHGQRGPVVTLDFEKHHAISMDWERFLADRAAGNIEVVE